MSEASQTLYPADFWKGYRYEIFKDDTSRKTKLLRDKIIAEFDSLTGERKEAALKGCEYAAKERDEIRKNFCIDDKFNHERLDVVERLALKGCSSREIAIKAGIAQNTANNYRRELVRRGRLPESVLRRGK